MTQTARVSRYSLFVAVTLTVNAMAWMVRDETVRTALFFDCAITVPLCYWLLLVRSGMRGKASLALIAAVSLMRGAYLLNSRFGMIAGGLAEVGLVCVVATRVKRLEDVLPSKTLARIAKAEIDVYRYAFGSSKAAALAPGARAFTIHEASGAASLFWVIAMLTPVEAAVTHFLLPAKIAWIFTALSVYGAVWMIAAARSFAALPVVVDGEGVLLRKGMLASLYVPREAIASVSREAGAGVCGRFAVLSDPTVFLTFKSPLTMVLPMGFTRQVTSAAIAPDKVGEFLSAINES